MFFSRSTLPTIFTEVKVFVQPYPSITVPPNINKTLAITISLVSKDCIAFKTGLRFLFVFHS